MKASLLTGIAGSLALAWAAGAAAAEDALSRLLSCAAGGEVISAEATRQLAEAAGWQCRLHRPLSGNVLQCSPGRGGRALGLDIKEFERIDQADGGVRLAVAFRAAPDRVRQALAGAPAHPGPRAGAEVGEREDGVGELHCRLRGADGATGSIAGSLSFRGVEPVPAMRVCAAPRIDPGRPVCVETRTGETGYRIPDLPAGEYYVTAFPLADNPNRLIAAHTRPLAACAPGQPACAGEQLAVVAVAAGSEVPGIDPYSLLASLPPPLGGRDGALRRGR